MAELIIRLITIRERNTPMGRVLMHYLLEWRNQTPYGRPSDFVFPSLQKRAGSDLRLRILPRSFATIG